MISLYLSGVGVRAPGLDGWAAAREILAGNASYSASPILVPDCELLPPAERRRALPSVKLALAVANEAVLSAGQDRANITTTFASTGGDGRTLHEILTSLASPAHEISPTRFHNSVHNAAAGYWHIAAGSREASTSLACYDESFAAGLLDAASHVATEAQPILLVAYDLPYPAPLDAARPICGSFGSAFLLTPALTARSFARMEISLLRNAPCATRMDNPALETLRAGNPAARSLPVLKLLAQGGAGVVHLRYVADNTVAVAISRIDPGHSGSTGSESLLAPQKVAMERC